MRHLNTLMQRVQRQKTDISKPLLQEEEKKGERLAAYARIALACCAVLIGLFIRTEIPHQSFLAIIWGAALSLAFSTFIILCIRTDHYRKWVIYLSSTFDIVLLTVILYFFGTYRTFKAEAYLLYYFWISLAGIRFSYRLTLYSGALAMACFSFLAFLGLLNGSFHTGTLSESYVSEKISLGVIGIRLSVMLVFTMGAFYFSHVARHIIYRLAVQKRDIARVKREEKKVKEAFDRYVSPEVARQVLRSGAVKALSPMNATILFCDTRNFTRLSEELAPEQVIQLLNVYFTTIVDTVNEFGGFINKFTGDGFLACFGIPSLLPRQVEMAVRCALTMRDRIDTLNKHRQSQKERTLEFGFSLHCGEVVAGDIGSGFRKEYTVIGSVVNTAARVEELNRVFGSKVLVTQEVYEQVESLVKCRPKPSRLVKGIAKPVKTYEILEMKEALVTQAVDRKEVESYGEGVSEKLITYLERLFDYLRS